MNKRFKKLDAIAAAMLIGTVGAMAAAQVEGPPSPAQQWCAGGSITINGITKLFGGRFCPSNWRCGLDIQYTDDDGNFTVERICLPPNQ